MLINNITPKTSLQFFQAIKPCLSRSAPPSILATVLTEISQLFKRSPDFISSFIESGLLDQLSFTDTQYLETIYVILLSVAKVYSDKIPVTIITSLLPISTMHVNKVVSLFSEVAHQAKTNPNCTRVIEPFLNSSELILSTDFAPQYTCIITSLLENSPEFKCQFRDKCLSIFNRGLQSPNAKTICSSYSALIGQATLASEVDVDLISRHLSNAQTQELASQMLLMMTEPPSSKLLINSLIENAPSLRLAPLILLKITKSSAGASYLIKDMRNWIDAKFGVGDTLLIVMALFGVSENRKAMSEVPEVFDFFVRVIESRDTQPMQAVAAMVRRMPLTPKAVANACAKEIVEKFMAVALASGEWELVGAGLLMTEALARVAFTDAYLKILPAIPTLLEKAPPQIALMVLSFATVLSYYDRTHKEILGCGVPQAVGAMKIPEEFLKYRNIIFENLRNSKTIA